MLNHEQQDVKESAPWARDQFDAWQKAKDETEQIQRVYNNLLTAVDAALKIPLFEETAANLRKLQQDLNNLYQIDGVFRQDSGRRYSSRWWLRRLSPTFWFYKLIEVAIRPFIKQQQEFNAATVHYLNDTTDYLASTSVRLKQLFELKAGFFLQITPWIDVKIREIQMEQNFNLAHHYGMIVHNHINKALQEYNELLQKQLQSIYTIVQPITILEQQLLQVHRELEDLWHMLRKADTLLDEISKDYKDHIHKIQNEVTHRIETARDESTSQIERNRRELEVIARKHDDFKRDLESFEERYYPGIRVEPFVLEKIQQDLEQLKEQNPVNFNGNNGDNGRPAKQWEFPKARDLRYAAFEEIFRGSSDWLKKKMQVYVDHFRNAAEPILDLGCGRGEFLSLMKEAGKDAYGVEINEYESKKLRENGYRVVTEDAIKHVESLKDQSLGAVFCAQVVEHLTPEDVYTIVSGLHRKIKPGGLFLIETINPLSIEAFHKFYLLDPTHIYPVHPQTLVFFLRYAGFSNVQVHKSSDFPKEVQVPYPDQINDNGLKQYLKVITDRLNSILYGSAEYFVIGYKK